MDIDRILADLEQDIARLKRQYDRFFVGAEKLSPERERERIANEVKRLNAMTMQSSGQRFYFQSIMSRFYSYCELWNRQQRAREEGTIALPATLVHKVPKPLSPVAAAPRAAAASQADEACLVRTAGDRSGIGKLYDQFVALRGQTGEDTQKLNMAGFEKLIDSQYKALAAKLGAQSIEFRVAIRDGKVQLKAKPTGK